jgi:hypothetical protein
VEEFSGSSGDLPTTITTTPGFTSEPLSSSNETTGPVTKRMRIEAREEVKLVSSVDYARRQAVVMQKLHTLYRYRQAFVEQQLRHRQRAAMLGYI